MAASTLLSGGILNNGTLGGYISNATRLALGMGLAELQDGQVHYFSKHHDLLKRAAIQVASQTAYGLLRSYPRYLKYWEQRVRDKYLETKSQSSLANKTGQYYQLIKEQQAVAQKKNYMDTIVGRTVADYLELSISYADKGLQVIGISVDDDSVAWRQALAKHDLDYCPQVLSCESANDEARYFPEEANLADLYQVTQIPCLILINRDGRIAARWQRITPTEEAQLEEMLR